MIHGLKHFVVERARTARRFIKSTNPPYRIEELTIIEIDKKGDQYLAEVKTLFSDNRNVGLISESGMPAIADPGSEMVSLAHKHGVTVKQLTEPSSLFLALSASGLNGQSFAFRGYLPIKENEIIQKIKQLETIILKENQTQIFIETPYRNERIFKFLTQKLSAKIRLCIAKDVTGQEEYIKTRTISEWKKHPTSIGKIPTIYLIGL